MNSLRRKGKEKIRFRSMNPRITSRNFQNFKRLFIECLRENYEIKRILNQNYSRIQVYFFWETSDPGVEVAVRQALNDNSYTFSTTPIPATTISRNRRGCILVFLGHLMERIKQRDDIKDIQKYYKNGFFEELCHLVEHRGDIRSFPPSYDELWELSLKSQPRKYWDAIREVIFKLVADRNHYEVYLMVIKSYPQDWIDRYYLYFTNDADTTKHKENYENWKKTTNDRIALARLLAHYLGNLATLLASFHLSTEVITEEQKDKLDFMTAMGNDVVKSKLNLIKEDNQVAYELLKSLDECIYQSRDSYFSFILKLWKSVKLS